MFDPGCGDLRRHLRYNGKQRLLSLVCAGPVSAADLSARALPAFKAEVREEDVWREVVEATAFLTAFRGCVADQIQPLIFPQFTGLIKVAETTGKGSCLHYGLSLGLVRTDEPRKLLRTLCLYTLLQNERFDLTFFLHV